MYDGSGAAIATRDVYGGNNFTDDELRNLTSKDIDDRLNNKMGDSLSNFNVPPGASLPFSIVFFDVPETISSVSVAVLESQATPP